MDDPSGQRFRRNSGWVLAVFFFWSFLCISSVFYYSVIRQKELRQTSRQIAWRQGDIPALKGTIYSSDGRRLAYSVLEFFIFYKRESTGEQLSVLLNRPVSDGDLVSAREVQILEPHLGAFRSPFRIEARETRKCQPGSEKFEQKYKDILRGQDGLFVVMLDRFGKRVPGTMKVVRQQVPGKSVTLRPDEEKEVLR